MRAGHYQISWPIYTCLTTCLKMVSFLSVQVIGENWKFETVIIWRVSGEPTSGLNTTDGRLALTHAVLQILPPKTCTSDVCKIEKPKHLFTVSIFLTP